MMAMKKLAVIDIGTNSIKFCIAQKAADGTLDVLKDANDIARLGEGLRETGLNIPNFEILNEEALQIIEWNAETILEEIGVNFVESPEALERNAQAVKQFAQQAKDMGADEVFAVGTMALRTAKNTNDFIARVKELTGLTVKVLPGDEEARLAYLAVLSALPLQAGELVIFDTGGGSTEFIFGKGKTLDRRFSVNLGAVPITEKYFADDPVKAGSVQAAAPVVVAATARS